MICMDLVTFGEWRDVLLQVRVLIRGHIIFLMGELRLQEAKVWQDFKEELKFNSEPARNGLLMDLMREVTPREFKEHMSELVNRADIDLTPSYIYTLIHLLIHLFVHIEIINVNAIKASLGN